MERVGEVEGEQVRNRAREGEGGGEKRGGRERGMWGRTACGCLSS